MATLTHYWVSLTLIAAGSVIALPGCMAEVEDPELSEEAPLTAAPDIGEPTLEAQANEFCCYANCSQSTGWKYVGQVAWGSCRKAAKAYCVGLGQTYQGADWRPCP